MRETENDIDDLISQGVIINTDELLILRNKRDTLSFLDLSEEIDLMDLLPTIKIPHNYLSKSFDFLKKQNRISCSPVSLAKKNQSLYIGDSWVRFIKRT